MRRALIALCALFLGVCMPVAAQAPDSLPSLYDARNYRQLIQTAEPLAQAGNAEAQFFLAKVYHFGEGVDQDLDKAAALYALAVKQNEPRAMNNLAMIQLERDPASRTAPDLLTRAAALGIEQARGNLRRLNLQLCFSKQDHDLCMATGDAYAQAWQTQRKPAMLDDSVVAYATACGIARDEARFSDDDNKQQIATTCKRAMDMAETGAAEGLPDATYVRGQLAYMTRDYSGAGHWYRLADERGHGEASLALGRMYEHGRGVAADPDQAALYYRRAAARGEKSDSDQEPR